METSLIIDNIDRSASNSATFERRNPNSGEVVTRAAAATAVDARAAVDSAQRAFSSWSRTGPNARREVLLAASRLLAARTEEFTHLMVGETGASLPWVRFNVQLAAGMLVEAASITTQIKGEIIPSDKPGTFSMALRRPAGVVLSITPWNAPIILTVRAFATALACGNTVVLKASELSPGTQYVLANVVRGAGLPPGVMNFITNAPTDSAEVVEAMVAHPAVRRVNFTGSTRTGRIIAQLCARYLKPALLELGGKAPLLILADADVDKAVNAATFGAFVHQGQVCMSTERIVVVDAIADQFTQAIAAKAKTLRSGDPNREQFPLGSLVSREAAQRVKDLIDEALAKGATLLAGGTVTGAVVGATVLDNVNSSMGIYHQESFGPVACIVRVKDDEEAVRVANDTEMGLSSGIFSRDIRRALSIAQQLDFGCCHINGPTVHDEAQMPLGGMKASGYGRFGGQPGINEFTEVQWVTIEDPDQHYPF